MTRWWVSWWCDMENLAPHPSWPWWVTSYRDRDLQSSVCAVIDAPSEADVWSTVEDIFGPCEPRFADPKPDEWQPPADRFPNA